MVQNTMTSLISIIYRCFLAFSLLLLMGFLTACSDGSDSSHPEEKIVLLDLLPASTRGFLQLPAGARAVDGAWLEGSGDAVAPWRHGPVDILRYYSGQMDLVSNAEQLILAQPDLTGEEYVVLVDIEKNTGDALLDDVETESGGKYGGFSLLELTDNGLFLAKLNSRTWVIAPRNSLEQVIDVHVGSLPGIEESAIAAYLDGLDDTLPLYFIYGLPGLYGEVSVPGSGDASLNPAAVVRGAFGFNEGVLAGSMQFITSNAVGYTERLLGLLPEDSPAIIDAVDDTINIDITGLSGAADVLPLLKSLYIGMNAVDYAEAVTHGGNVPWMNFNVGENPNSIFINFEFTDKNQRDAFEAEHLPTGFTLAPLRILESDEPRYFLVLNIYQSSGGLVEGARAEWSVFINDPATSVPRFLVVQAAAENITVDSVNLLVLPEPVFHVLETDAIVSFVGVEDENTENVELYFSSRINWPQQPETHVTFHREFVAANDFIFWGNAVADRGLYNASVHNRPAALIEAGEISFVDESRWSSYINPQPVHTVAYLNPLEIVISPWWNLDEDYLDVTDAYRQELIDFKNTFYPGTVLGIAELAMLGKGAALTSTTSGESIATAHYHFVIEDPEALLASVGAQGEYTPVAISLDGTAAPDMYLTLEVTQRENDPCGLRADWSMYVLNEKERMQTLQLETLSSDACLDPVSLLGLPAVVEQGVEQMQLTTRIASPFIRFSATLDLSNSEERLAGQDWIEAGDQLCSLNDVCDFSFYDGQTLIQPLQRPDFGGVIVDEITTPWDDFIDTQPALVTVRQFPAIRAFNPWRNVPPFGS